MAMMASASASVMAFEMMIGQLPIRQPNKSQSATPMAKLTYMNSEIARVSLWRMMCSACGTKAAVVSVAATLATIISVDMRRD